MWRTLAPTLIALLEWTVWAVIVFSIIFLSLVASWLVTGWWWWSTHRRL